MVIGIAGGSGSGKTTFARKLLTVIGEERALILEQDSYYRDQSARFVRDPATVNFDHPDAIDFQLMLEQLRELKSGKTIQRPTYDFVKHQRFPNPVQIPSKPIVIVEGILIFHAQDLFKEFDLSFFMETTEALRLQRRITRDTRERGRNEAEVLKQFYAQVKPMHDQFVQPTKKIASYVIET